MNRTQNKDTRYFIEVDLKTSKVVNNDFAHKLNLDKGRQKNPNIHRLFLTKGQYNKFIDRRELS